MIQRLVEEANAALLAHPSPTAREIAAGVEVNQQFIDYLDDLELHGATDVTVDVDGTRLRFPEADGFAKWLAGVMK